jgi:hypothetical protein
LSLYTKADPQNYFGADVYAESRLAPAPVFSLGALVAPAGTRGPAVARRQVDSWRHPEHRGSLGHHIIPKQMSHTELLQGVRWLGNCIYQPESFGDRVMHALKRFKPNRSARQS